MRSIASIIDNLVKTSDPVKALQDSLFSINRRILVLEDAEKSRADGMDAIITSIEPGNAVCDECISMRLELDAAKKRLEALESKRPGRRKSDAK